MHIFIIINVEPEINALIDGEPSYQTMLVIHMSAQRTNPVRRKDMILIFFHT